MEAFEGFSLHTLFSLLGGLSVFLFGLDMMSINLRKAAGSTLKLILEKATDNHFIGVIVGTVVTALIQSSSATTSILISFVQSQLMSFERSIAVIMGANIGTTITAQIVAFKVTKWSLAIITIGFLISLISQRPKTKYIAYTILGLGLLFYGLEIMSGSMKVLRSSDYFLELMQSLENVGLGILVGAVFTALIQSSSASLGIVIGMAMQGLVTIEAALPLILGANIGTCITAVLAAINSHAAAKRVAAAHVLFNVFGVLMFAFWVPQFTAIISQFTPADDVPRFIANAQTSFNIIATLVWFPFIPVLEKMARAMIPNDKNPQRTKYIFPKASELSNSPELLFIQSNDAICKYKRVVIEMLWLSREYFIHGNKEHEETLSSLREYQKEFREDILNFLGEISKLKLDSQDVQHALDQVSLVNEIEHIAYKLEVSLVNLKSGKQFFDESYQGLHEYFKQTIKNFSKSCNAILNEATTDVEKIAAKIDAINSLELELRNQSIEKIRNDDYYEDDKLNLWVLEFLRTVNASSKKITEIKKNYAIKL